MEFSVISKGFMVDGTTNSAGTTPDLGGSEKVIVRPLDYVKAKLGLPWRDYNFFYIGWFCDGWSFRYIAGDWNCACTNIK